jgi:signal peptidase I
MSARKRLAKIWREWVKSILLVVLIVTSFRSAIADWNDVPTGSMKPTILEGDRIVVNKLAYDLKLPFTTWRLATWGDPARGDIVVLYSPADGKRLVKRVIGVPGDFIAMRANHLAVNGSEVSYSPIAEELAPANGEQLVQEEQLGSVAHPVMLTPNAPSRHSFAPIMVPEGSYFVLGDNRDQSLDSRYFGFVDRSMIVGRATAVAASVDPFHHYSPRWSRFFQALR